MTAAKNPNAGIDRALVADARRQQRRVAARVVTKLVTPFRGRRKSFENQHFESSPELALGAGGRWFESSRPDHFSFKSPVYPAVDHAVSCVARETGNGAGEQQF